MNYNKLCKLILVCCLFLFGQTNLYSQSNSRPQYANAEAGWQWIASTDGITYIPVCWENPDGYSVETEWVKSAVANTWASVANVSFYGWNRCANNNRGVRILITDTRSNSHIGRNLDGKNSGMQLNFTFRRFVPSCQASNRKEYCIKSIAVHEFGHALGFVHEQDRDDSPCSLERNRGGGWKLTDYDPSSVMNYCNPRWNNDGVLSPKDIKGVQILYGAKAVNSKRYFTISNSLDPGSGQVWENIVFDFSNAAGSSRQFFNVNNNANTQIRNWTVPSSGQYCYKVWSNTLFTDGKTYKGYGAGCLTLTNRNNYKFTLVQVGWNKGGYFNLKIQNTALSTEIF